MFGQKSRVAILALTLVPLGASPARACNWCRSWFGAPATTTYYAPYSVGYAPAACPTVVNYVPQTSYRTVYYNAPVTSYAPMTACNACGGATTVMRPVTTYVTQARLVPYTTYRPVVTAAPVATAAYYAPVVPAAPACCRAGYAPTALTSGYAPLGVTAGYAPAPVVAGYAPAPVTAGYAVAPVTSYGSPPVTAGYAPAVAAPLTLGAPGTTVQSLTPVPAPQSAVQAPAGGYPTAPTPAPANQDQPQTFEKPSDSDAPQPQSRIVLPPRSGSSNTSGAPRALDPEDALDQSTALPLRRSLAMRPVSTSSLDRPVALPVDDGGWRSARQ